jgi:uncharacterized heparinase superfamily protein
MADFLRKIVHPDGEIPLFNDSAFGFITRPAAELLAQVGSPHTTRFQTGPGVSVLAETGYAVVREPASESCLIFDCGPLGPDYQPGHGHCDLLSYELSLHGERVVVDTGVSTYEVGGDRHYERSTAAHNTLRIDSSEQAEIWAGFRVGRRPRAGRIEKGEIRGVHYVRGKHFGYQYLGVVHSRAIIHAPGNFWVVVDSLSGRGRHRVESFIHFHPSIRVEPSAGSAPEAPAMTRQRWIIHLADSRYLLRNLGVGEYVLTEGWYSPEFGVRQTQTVLHCMWEGKLPARMLYIFEPEGAEPLVVNQLNDQDAVAINGIAIPLSGDSEHSNNRLKGYVRRREEELGENT